MRETDQFDSDDPSSDHNHLLRNFLEGKSSCRRHNGVLVNLWVKQHDMFNSQEDVQFSFPSKIQLHRYSQRFILTQTHGELGEKDGPWIPYLNSREGCDFRASGNEDVFGVDYLLTAVSCCGCHLILSSQPPKAVNVRYLGGVMSWQEHFQMNWKRAKKTDFVLFKKMSDSSRQGFDCAALLSHHLLQVQRDA